MNATNQLQFGAASEARAAVILAGLGFTGEARFRVRRWQGCMAGLCLGSIRLSIHRTIDCLFPWSWIIDGRSRTRVDRPKSLVEVGVCESP